MNNYQYFLQLYLQDQRSNYVSSYQAAYRDLMAVYNDQAKVRSLLLQQLATDKKSQAALLRQMTKGVGSTELLDLVHSSLQVAKEDKDVEWKNAQLKENARKEVDELYEPTIGGKQDMIDKIIDLETAPTGGLGAKTIEEMMKIMRVETTQAQRTLMSEFGPRIASIKGVTTDQLYSLLNVPYIPNDQLIVLKADEAEARYQPIPKNKQLVQSKQILNRALYDYPEEGTEIKVKDKVKGLQAIKAPQGKSLMESLAISPPTETEIRALAADYYRPYGTKKFEEEMVELDLQRKKKTPTTLKKEAKNELIRTTPPWAAKMLSLSAEVDPLIDKTEEELSLGQGGKYAKLLVQKKLETPEAILNIEEKFADDPDAQRQALIYLGIDIARKYKTKNDTTVDLTSFVEEIE